MHPTAAVGDRAEPFTLDDQFHASHAVAFGGGTVARSRRRRLVRPGSGGGALRCVRAGLPRRELHTS